MSGPKRNDKRPCIDCGKTPDQGAQFYMWGKGRASRCKPCDNRNRCKRAKIRITL